MSCIYVQNATSLLSYVRMADIIADNVILQLYSLDELSNFNFISFLRFGVTMDIQD